ncbi:MAG: GNVR domain-containing protein [Sporomusaceae bacterium]|nr:GNVR domain-containing protein [Sporomusaceae bacterium]
MEEQDTIDLGQVWRVAKEHSRKLAGIIVVCTLAALLLAMILPKQYESSVLMRAKNQKQGGVSLQATAALALLGGSVSAPLQSYQEMLKSRNVLDPVIATLDLADEDKEKLSRDSNKTFIKQYLAIDNPKGTDLLQLTATGRSPEEAQQIAAGVVSSFQRVLTEMNQSEQSLQLKFLSERVSVSKQEMEQAEKNLEQFRQQTKLFVPDEQAKALVKALSEIDRQLAEQQVAVEANRAKQYSVNQQLRQQNAAMTEFNIAENEVVTKIRANIVEKQMELVGLRQRYMDKHPEVILVKKEVDELTATLKAEINKAVQSGANVLSPVQGELLQAKVETEATLVAGQAAVDAIRQVQTKNAAEISSLSANSLQYVALERQARIAQEVYAVLVKNYEQTRIQEAMESMDVQLVDAANLPQKPSGPRKLLITAVGSVIGMMLAAVYLLIAYSRQMEKRTFTG